MALVHDTSYTIGDVFNEIVTTLNESKLRWFTEEDILAAIQEAYNKIVALLSPIESSTFIPQQSGPYYNLGVQIPNFMYVTGIYNPQTNRWLEGMSFKMLKSQWQTYLAIGQPRFFNIVDFNRVTVWPYQVAASGVLYVLFKTSAPTISLSHVPILPHSVGTQMIEYFATADLFEQAREFTKAGIWWAKLFSPPAKGKLSIFEQAKLEIKSLARNDRELVLEPYRWMFHGGAFNVATWINNETPSGTVDGSNAIFTIAGVPNPVSSLLVQRNGVIQYNNQAFGFNGQTITFNTNFIPQTGDAIRAWYQIQ